MNIRGDRALRFSPEDARLDRKAFGRPFLAEILGAQVPFDGRFIAMLWTDHLKGLGHPSLFGQEWAHQSGRVQVPLTFSRSDVWIGIPW